MSISAGTKLGRYSIRSKIGEGGMGEVYRARDEKLNRDVAIKVLPATFSENADRLHRFEQEAQAAGSLNHPNILAVYDVGTHEGAPYVVSELLEGETLRELFEQSTISPRKAIQYSIQLTQGLAAAHEKGIVHRDLAIETLNAILKEEPAELASTSPNVAPALERVVWHCLEKSPERRFQSASDIAFALESLSGVTSHPSQQTLTRLAPRSSIFTRERLAWLTVCAALLITAAVFAFAYLSRSQSSAGSVRLSLTTPEKTSQPAHVTVSPDGSRVVFVATDADGKRLLWIRQLDSLTAQALTGTDGATSPFWSPDSHSIGFFANGKLYKIDAAGGRPKALCDVYEDKGGAWNRDGVILFADPGGLYRVSAQGGTPVLATKVQPKEEAHRWPYFLPDGRHFVFLADAPTTENHHIRLGSLDSQDTQILFSAVTRIVYSPPGYLLYVSQGTLVAQAFDAGKLKTAGEPVTIAEHVTLTLDPESDGDPVWSPDGTRIVFTSNRGTDGHIHLYTTSVSGAGDDELLTKADADDIPSHWSSDGQKILFSRYGPTQRGGIWLLSLNGQREAKPLLQSPNFYQATAIFSPNDRFVAYVSNESGRYEVYVQTFPPGNKSAISPGGGVYPTWRGDGKELFYLTEDGRVMAAQIKSDAPFQADVPQQLFQTNIKFGTGYPYAVNRDGSRFLIITPAEANNSAPLTVVLNWTASLKQPK